MDEISQIFTPRTSINSEISSPTNIGDTHDITNNQQELPAERIGSTRRISTIRETSKFPNRQQQLLAGNGRSQLRSPSIRETSEFPNEQQRQIATHFREQLKRKVAEAKANNTTENIVKRVKTGTKTKKSTPPAGTMPWVGSIFYGRLQNCSFEIDVDNLQSSSSIISTTNFDHFWEGLTQRKFGQYIRAKIFEYRTILHEAWAYRVLLSPFEKSDKKRVNRWEYLNIWRQIASTGGWFIDDLPPELHELSKILHIDYEPRLDADGEKMCIELYESWEKAHLLDRAKRSDVMGKELFRLFDDVK
jgi:hypothetical protein